MTLKADNLTKAFDGAPALDGVTLAIETGSIHALVGENGAGKTTLLKILAGIYRPDAGAAKLDGQPVYENPPIKARVAFVPAQCTLFGGYHERDLLRFFGGVYPSFSEERYRAFLGDMDFGRKTVRGLSTGMQMIVSVALALATEPDALLLDEPFAGLDVIIRHRLITMLIEESDARGTAMLISSHNVNELERLCDKATFLTRGKINRSGELDRVKREAIRRLQVVFLNDEPAGLDDWEGILSIDRIGKVCYINVDGTDATIDERLKKAGLYMCEELGITLEDAFRYSYEREAKG